MSVSHEKEKDTVLTNIWGQQSIYPCAKDLTFTPCYNWNDSILLSTININY